MKAAVCYEFGKPLVIEDIEIGSPQEGQVKVRLAATAICHTDVHAIKGEIPVKVPIVVGHESAGYIEEVGGNINSVKPGDAVVISLITSCGKCRSCKTGYPHLCEDRQSLSRESPLRNQKGQKLEVGFNVAGFAEQVIVHESQIAKIPAELPMDRAALLGCGVITGFGSVVNRAQVKPGSSVVVIGTGGVGLNAIQGAAFSGAYPVIAVDVLDTKLQSAQSFGATHTINSKNNDPVEMVKKMTGGRGVDFAFITVGSTAAIKQGLLMCCRRGLAVIVGLTRPQDTFSFSAFDFLNQERMLAGAYMGSTNISVEIPRLVALYQAGKLKLDELITGRYPLDHINEALESVERGEALRNVITFG